MEIIKNMDNNNIENVKNIINMIYDNANIYEVDRSLNGEAIIFHIDYGEKSKVSGTEIEKYSKQTNILYKFRDDTTEELNIVKYKKLPISNNLAIITEENDYSKAEIRVLDRKTFDTLYSKTIELNKSYSLLKKAAEFQNDYGYIEINRKDAVAFGLPTGVNNTGIMYGIYNIHGELINIDQSYHSICKASYISVYNNEIRRYNNIEDMQYIESINLKTFDSKISYYPIINSNNDKEYTEQVIFMRFNESGNVYAYCLNDKQLHIVYDTRIKLNDEEVLNIIDESLEEAFKKSETLSENDKQFMVYQSDLDKKLVLTNNNSRLPLSRETEHGRAVFVLRTFEKLVENYQYEFNRETSLKYNITIDYQKPQKIKLKNKSGTESTYNEIAKTALGRTTHYTVESLKRFEDIRVKQVESNRGKLEVGNKTVDINELAFIEKLKDKNKINELEMMFKQLEKISK